MEWAENLGLEEYMQPSGGCCFLADPNFARRFRDLIAYAPATGRLGTEDTTLLKVGRHFRLSSRLKVIAGRNEGENRFLRRFATGRWAFATSDESSTMVLCLGEPDEEESRLVGSIVARYSRHREKSEVEVVARRDGVYRRFRVPPAGEDALQRLRI
jgi:hypothetical protein